MKISWLVLLCSSAIAQTTDQTGSVSGAVTDAVTHMPVKKASVTLQPNGNFATNVGQQSTTTDAGGAFTLTNLQAGKYRLTFQQQSYPEARFGGLTKNIEVKAGESTASVNVELIPGAALTGHIVDEDGDPLPNCNVQIHPAKNPNQGVPMAGSSGSNQDGEYRLYGIPAGKYILSAQCGQMVFQPRPFSSGPEPPPSKAYPMIYYPLTRDAKSAQVVELTPGNEKSGVDFQMSPVGVTQVRGVFSPGGADWHAGGQLQMQLVPVGERINNFMSTGGGPNMEKGTFEFRQVFAGSYMLVAFTQGNEDKRVGAFQRIDVSDRPLELTLELKQAIELMGKIEIEGNANSTNKLTPTQVNIQLVPEYQIGVPFSQAQGNDDGTFTIKGVLPCAWRLNLNAPSGFLKTAWLGSTDVTNAPLDLSSGAVGTLKVLVSMNTATIRGSAPAGSVVQAQLVDDAILFRGNRGTGVDQSGQYKFEGLPPGKYRLVLMDAGGPMPVDGGQEITVREGETAMLDLKAPSAQ